MITILDTVRAGDQPWQVEAVALAENTYPAALLEQVAMGSVVIMQRGKRLTGIGRGLRTKVNVNLGTSSTKVSLADELGKAAIAETFGADTISDLSMGGDIDAIREEILIRTTLPVTTVPVYQTVVEKGLSGMTEKDILTTMRKQAEQGVSSFVVHCVTGKMLDEVRKRKRVLGIVSKGGSMTSAHMLLNQCENPFIEHYDEILSLCREHDIVLSLGNTARSGCIHDRRDKIQLEELGTNIAFARRAHEAGVQVIIEGCGGHIRGDRISRYIRAYKNASPFPLFVAGPLPTDIAAGYDHIAGCAGASLASAAGADYLCYLTPAEHLGLPGPSAVKEGLIAFRIAAHIGDTMKYGRDAEDREIALMRAALDREGQVRKALDPARAAELCGNEPECTMCGEHCAIRIMKELDRGTPAKKGH
ncbi:MAG: phosphomethylpyrimidine synthase ThiC [Methanoregulaceae archaeon]|nr:phosphomethylpyrimidine synthase ThiC [Methanoregulaceae archaeon]